MAKVHPCETPSTAKCELPHQPENALSTEDTLSDAVMMFGSPHYYYKENQVVWLDVIRVGSLSGQVSVTFATQDGTCSAGADYAEANGELLFKDGERVKKIYVILFDGARIEWQQCTA